MAPRKRARYGGGSVINLAPGRYRLFVSLGPDPLTGKPRRKSKVVEASSDRAASKLLAEFVATDDGGRSGQTLGGLLAEYLDSRHDMSPSTRADFESYLRRALTDHLRRIKLRDLGPRHLDTLYGHLLREGGVDGKALSPATVRRVHTILHAALEQAVRWDYIPTNPASRTRPPALTRRETTLPPAEHLVRLLARLDELPHDTPGQPGSPLPLFVALLLATGARPGELCALRWEKVDLDTGRLLIDANLARGQGGAIEKTTKTGRGRRIHLAGPVVDLLRARHAAWRPAALAAGIPLDRLPLFPSTKNAEIPWRPDSISREFRYVRDELTLSDDLTLRNLRHLCVSLLAAAGVDVVTAAKRFGHSPKVMLDVYAHAFDEGDQRAADVLGEHAVKRRTGQPQ